MDAHACAHVEVNILVATKLKPRGFSPWGHSIPSLERNSSLFLTLWDGKRIN